MPVYEYECLKCGVVHEMIQKFSDAPFTECPICSGKLKKIISNTSFILKGTGWYKTDYASSSNKETANTKTKTETKTQTKAEVKTEDKTEAKTESKPEAAAKA